MTFTREIPIEDIPVKPKTYRFEFPDSALPDIAERLEAEAVRAIYAEISVERHGTLIRVSGTVTAMLDRICVHSLEPMEEEVTDAFSFELEHVDEMHDLEGEMEIDLDAPEPVSGDVIDLAEIAVQQVSLAMEPFPRKPDAKPVEDTGEQPSLSPFAALKSLKED